MWAYMYFCMRLKAMAQESGEDDMSEVEAIVWRLIRDLRHPSIGWFPTHDKTHGGAVEADKLKKK
jgi:hypothetical protein